MNFDEKLTELLENGVNGSERLTDGIHFSWETCKFSDDVDFYIGSAKVGYMEAGELPHPDDGENDMIEVLVQSMDSPLLDEANEMRMSVHIGRYIENPIDATAEAFMEAVAWDWLTFARAMMIKQ